MSAIVVNRNGGARVIRCLESLYAQDFPLAEIIVVDDASTDDSCDRIRSQYPGVRLHRLGENRGPGAARNAGLRLARSGLVLFIDNDLYLERDGLRRLVARLQADGPAIVCPRIVHHPERSRLHCDGAAAHFVGTMLLLRGEEPVADAPADWTDVGGCLSACLLLERSLALDAGGFDEDYFFYFEDLEFSIRLAGWGHRFLCDPAGVAYHDRGEGTPGLSFRGDGAYPARRFYLTARNRWMTILIHYRFRTLIVLAPALALYELAVLGLALRRGWLLQWLSAWFWQPAHTRALLAKRRGALLGRRRRDRELLRGGPLPLAPGLIQSRTIETAVSMLSAGLNLYWRLARRWIG